jgi:antitoxin MazE
MASLSRRIALKVLRIGNSRGVRLPKAILERYAIKDALVAEERDDRLLLRGPRDARLGWAETIKEMAREREDWSDIDVASSDGLDPEERW